MSSSRSTRSVTVPSDSGSARGAVVGTTPRCTGRALLERPARSSYAAAGSTSRSTETPAAPAPREQRDGHVGGAAVRDRRGTGLGHGREDPLQRGARPRGGSTDGAGGSRTRSGPAPASTAGSAGSSTCTQQVGARDPAAYVGDVVAQPSASAWASSRRAPWSASTRSPRGRSTVAASVHGPATWILNGAGVALGLLLERRRGPGPAATAPAGGRRRGASVSRQPAGCRSAPSSATTRQRATGHVGVRAAAGQLGQVRQVGQLVEHDARPPRS